MARLVKALSFTAVTLLLNIALAPPAAAQPGDLDTTFDFDGKVTTDFGGPFDRGSGVAIQSDGRIVVAGVSGDDVSGNDFVLARYKRDGTLDADFDIDGKVTTDFGSRFEEASSVAIQPDGKIVAAGFSGDFLVGDFALARYNRDGSLDTTFDADGKVTTDFGSFDQALGVAIQPDGRIVAAGFSGDFPLVDFVLARYSRDGSLDTSFDADGKVTTDFGSSPELAASVAIHPGGRIVAAGFSGDDFALARYKGDGSLDTSFDSDGKVTTDFGADDRALGVAIQRDGRIVAAGFSGDFPLVDFALARYDRNGSLDTSFDADGKVTTDFGSFDQALRVAIQPDGRIVAAGTSGDLSLLDFALARYNRDGSLDTSFDADGTVTTDFGSFDQALGVAIQPDGRIVAAGFSQPDFALARYLGR
jgi:uncharacterized delta-60 repeat protein